MLMLFLVLKVSMFIVSGYRDDYGYKNDKQTEVSVVGVRVIFQD